MNLKPLSFQFRRNARIGLLLLSAALSLLFASSCAGSRAWEATQVAQTETARPTPTRTLTPTPTLTLTPSPTFTRTLTPKPSLTFTPSRTFTPTPTLALDVLYSTFADVIVLSSDQFNHYTPGLMPNGWSGGRGRIRMGSNPFLTLIYLDSTVANNLDISRNRAVAFRFKFAPQSSFSMGLDAVQAGQLLYPGQPGYCSIGLKYGVSPAGMSLLAGPTVAYDLCDQEGQCTTGSYYFDGYLQGDMELQPDTWYMYNQAYLAGKQFIIKIWDPEDPSRMLTFRQPIDTMPNQANFVVHLENNAVLSLDDFTVLEFSGLLEDE